ncbi:hypothetical protein ACWDTR_23950 [Streptomyces sp. NPDC003470]
MQLGHAHRRACSRQGQGRYVGVEGHPLLNPQPPDTNFAVQEGKE